jgi:hypothetical protein
VTPVDTIKGAALAVDLVNADQTDTTRHEGWVLMAADAEPGHATDYTMV